MTYRRIYEINTRVWLAELVEAGQIPEANLGLVPQATIAGWRRWQIDAIWLMGVWEPSVYSARAVRERTGSVLSLQHAIDHFSLDDCVSSPYAVRSYTVAEQLGGLQGLLQFRHRLHQAGMALILDFVPNHTACDHPWVQTYPQYYVQGSPQEAARALHDYFPVQTVQGLRYIAHGKDPYFPSWGDTAQLNYSNLELHDAMQAQLLQLAEWCDGVRCDMAMLCLSEVFCRTWSRLDLPIPPREFWQEALAAVRQRFPEFCCIAEVYWGLQPRLQQLGFHLTYEKEFYDALLARDIGKLRASVQTPHAPLAANLRFLENHDEARAATCFSVEQQEAALLSILTLPGAVLLHEGQMDGHRIRTPAQLRRRQPEPAHHQLQALYAHLLTLPDIRRGQLQVLQAEPLRADDETSTALLTWAWVDTTQCWIVVINYSAVAATGRIGLATLPLPPGRLRFHDVLHAATYVHSTDTVQQRGLPVVLSSFGTHLFTVTPEP